MWHTYLPISVPRFVNKHPFWRTSQEYGSTAAQLHTPLQMYRGLLVSLDSARCEQAPLFGGGNIHNKQEYPFRAKSMQSRLSAPLLTPEIYAALLKACPSRATIMHRVSLRHDRVRRICPFASQHRLRSDTGVSAHQDDLLISETPLLQRF